MNLREMTTSELEALRSQINIELARQRTHSRAITAAVKVLRQSAGRLMPDSVKSVIREVAARHDLPPEVLLSKTAAPRIAHARWEAWTILRDREFSYPRIGVWFDKDHSTIVHGVTKYRATMAKRAVAA